MIDPNPHMTDQDLTYNFKADLACTWSKMIDCGETATWKTFYLQG